MPTEYDWRTDSSVLSNDDYETFLDPVSGDFTASVVVAIHPPEGATGVMIRNAGGSELHFGIGNITDLDDAVYPGPIELPVTVVLQYKSGVTTLWWSNDNEQTWTELAAPPQITSPTQAGAFFYTTTPGTDASALITEPRLLPGELLLSGVPSPPVEQFADIGTAPTVQPPPLTLSAEAIVHGIVGAQFGDLETDVGKSVRWTQWFCDDIFILDTSLGEQRYWVINWAESFPEANWAFADANFFVVPDTYRKEQWARAQKAAALTFDDNDWVVFVDAHEGLSADTRSLPDDYLIAPYQSYIYREIARANTAGRDRIVLPFFVYVWEDGPQNVEYDHPYWARYNTKAMQPCSIPYYLPYQGMTRIIKVSALRNPNFDWTLIDRPIAVTDSSVKVQLISYGYAHWNLQDIVPPATEVPSLTADNDIGWQQRCRMSRVLPITELPHGDYRDPVGTWQDPVLDVDGVRGPWALDIKPTTGADCPAPPGPPPAATAGILTPLYDQIVRLNMRDGLWYEAGGMGNVPLVWDENVGRWVPLMPADEWHDTIAWVNT